MISDYRNVGYANNFLRAPVEMYSQIPYSNLDGIDATWNRSFGDTTVTANLGVGRSEAPIVGDVTAKAKDVVAFNVTAEHGPFTARLSRVDATITIENTSLPAFEEKLIQVGTAFGFPQMVTMAHELDPTNKKASFTSVGLGMDWNNIVLQSEFAKRKTKTYINDTTSWYVMGGYRLGKFLPYVSHSSLKIDSAIVNTVPAACPAGYPAACTPTLQQLGAGVRPLPTVGVGQGEQSTNSFGFRWDFASSVALKAQLDRVKPKNGNGLFINVQPGFKDAVIVGAVGLDFVF